MLALNLIFYILVILVGVQLLFYQIRLFDQKDSNLCLRIFKSNNLVGLMILISIFIGKFN